MFNWQKHSKILSAVFLLALFPLFQNCGSSFTPKSSTEASSKSATLEIPWTPPVHPETKPKEFSQEPILADRYYIRSLFEDVFGSSAAITDSAKVFFDVANQGSPCAIYEDHQIKDIKLGKLISGDTMQTCSVSSPSRIAAQVTPKATVSRASLLARSCSDLTSNKKTVEYALSKISTDLIPASSEGNIRLAFKLFYRNGLKPEQAVIDSLSLMLPTSNVSIEDWKTVLYTICVSPQWQVL